MESLRPRLLTEREEESRGMEKEGGGEEVMAEALMMGKLQTCSILRHLW